MCCSQSSMLHDEGLTASYCTDRLHAVLTGFDFSVRAPRRAFRMSTEVLRSHFTRQSRGGL